MGRFIQRTLDGSPGILPASHTAETHTPRSPKLLVGGVALELHAFFEIHQINEVVVGLAYSLTIFPSR